MVTGLGRIVKAQEKDNRIIVSVKDTGVGIRESDLSKVKTKFYKANHTRRGSGIGLAVTNEIVNLHGGMLNIDSIEGKGTLVTILLPVEEIYEEEANNAGKNS